MNCYPPICRNCGGENINAHVKVSLTCPICSDARQYPDPKQQKWLGANELNRYSVQVDQLEEDIFRLQSSPRLGIGQSSYLLRNGESWLLWDPLPVVLSEDEAITTLGKDFRNLSIVASHPHMYGNQTRWAQEFNGTVYLNENDYQWANLGAVQKRTWKGSIQLEPSVVLHQLGGHFPGSSILIWTRSNGEKWLFTSDTAQIRPNGRFAFMWSYPNLLPLNEIEVRSMISRLPRTEAIKALDNFGRVIDGDIDQHFKKSAVAHLDRLRN